MHISYYYPTQFKLQIKYIIANLLWDNRNIQITNKNIHITKTQISKFQVKTLTSLFTFGLERKKPQSHSYKEVERQWRKWSEFRVFSYGYIYRRVFE